MKKRTFWIVMCILSICNGAFFFKASYNAMNRGIEGVDNQAGLLFIPVLWVMAVLVLVMIAVFTWVFGKQMNKDRIIWLRNPVQLSGLSPKEKVCRMIFIFATGFLMLLGYGLFANDPVWAVAYAFSGGALFVFLHTWIKASMQHHQGQNS